ncbi:abscisic acid 8'-hydroxylase 3 [Dioscorea cayenensis subsp. rotundata]|uniref:(+)-abscisic acid 8'-hydroxylase n=1 Tax=Dioscorea cayennensis subsp. rotundata TaxID=55577 RepID=A0AB40D138_DIOCR|nr:abscisic acid 8'-hydroxylase 3 [Dioscorea cayenensis subsp. rotundata]
MEIGYGIIYTILVLIFATYFFKRKHKEEGQFNGKLRLPPGSMGFPYVGETLQLYSQDPNVFFTNKQKRYGEIFKTHVLGCPCVMLASPEAARFVLVTQSNLFKPTYPRSKERMIGPSALFFNQGEYHMGIRKLVQSCLAPEALRAIVPEIERIVVSMLESLGHGQVINTFHTMKKLSFDVGILTIFGGKLEARYKVELKKNYFIVDKGYNSFPTNIPGTHYNKAIKARKRLSELLSEIMNKRRKNGKVEKDLLGYLMESKDNGKGSKLSDEQISDNIIGVLFAAQDTTASVLTWILKYLGEDSKLLEAVKVEQMDIYATNECGSQPLTWAQTRAMTLTNKVVLETLRMASIISFTFREAVADVEYKGFLIPKGWKVMPLFRNIHYNPDFFAEPHKFEPSRFSSAPKPNTFLPFGSGVHACPGNELAKLEILILLHHLVTKYRFEIVGPNNEIEYSPFPIPKEGLPMHVWRNELNHGA